MIADFTEADAAVTRAVTNFVNEIDSFFGKWEGVAPTYIVESLLRELSTDIPALAEEFKPALGPATSRLLDALAAYRDSRPQDR